MKVYGTPSQPEDVVNIKYLQDNKLIDVGGGMVVSKNVKIDNLITGGDLENPDDWQGRKPSNGHLIGAAGSGGSLQRLTNMTVGEKYLLSITLNKTEDKLQRTNVTFRKTNGKIMKVFFAPEKVGINVMNEVLIFKDIPETIYINYWPYAGMSDSVIHDDLMLINLTATFGAGNEPTKEQMDDLIRMTGYFDTITLPIGRIIL